MWPSLGYPKSRDEDPGNQGVVICDGVGTHLAYAVVKRAVELGLEIVVRAPHLSNVLQGEDTVNFKVSAIDIIILASCVALVIVDHVAVIFVAFVVVADDFIATTIVVATFVVASALAALAVVASAAIAAVANFAGAAIGAVAATAK